MKIKLWQVALGLGFAGICEIIFAVIFGIFLPDKSACVVDCLLGGICLLSSNVISDIFLK